MNVCLMPNFNRPEYLKLCTDLILKSQGARDNLYLFALDYGFDSKLLEVINKFPLASKIIKTPNKISGNMKQSFNVLNGLLEAYKLSDNLIYIIEDDIFIGRDFFKFHEAVQSNKLFCSIATKNHNSNFTMLNDLNAYYYGYSMDYQSLGVCMNKNSIDLIRPHINDDYFSNPQDYVSKNFNSFLGSSYCEQDGLIRRIREESNLEVAFPHIPRAYHAGFYGYHRYSNLPKTKTYEEKVSMLKRICFSKEEMKKVCLNDLYYFDSEPIDLDTDFTEMKLIQTKIGIGLKPGLNTKNNMHIPQKKFRKGALTARGLVYN